MNGWDNQEKWVIKNCGAFKEVLEEYWVRKVVTSLGQTEPRPAQPPRPTGAFVDTRTRRPHLDGEALPLRFMVPHQCVAALPRQVVVEAIERLHMVLPPCPADVVPLRTSIVH
jgi:hypothetical protein